MLITFDNCSMSTMLVLASFFLMFFSVKAQSPSKDVVTNFKPSLAVVIGVLSIIFFLTSILLIYAKFCHTPSSVLHDSQQLVRSRSRFSGIDKIVIESLPFFRFSSLKGLRQGLECAVCLSKFEDSEILRLLPKCKHGFHIDCVDQWLENHSSCPLCREKIKEDDLKFFTYSSSLRLRDDTNLEIFVQREEENRGVSSRFSLKNSCRKSDKGKKEEELPIQESDENGHDEEEVLHKLNHKIIVADVVLKNRWSSVSSSDLMFLNSEMINAMSTDRFSSSRGSNSNYEKSEAKKVSEDGEIMKIKEEMERKRVFESKFSQNDLIPFSCIHTTTTTTTMTMTKVLNPTKKRSMSEITAHPRFNEFSMKYNTGESSLPENDGREERIRSVWLPIARRTVQWFANRERRSSQSLNV